MSDIIQLYQDEIENLKPSGDNGQHKGNCRFHKDKNPSFSVNLNPSSTDFGCWICFAGCGSGNAVTFAEKVGRDPKLYLQNYAKYTTPSSVTNSVPQKKSIVQPERPLSRADRIDAMRFHNYLLDNLDTLKSTGKIPSCWTIAAIKKTWTGYDPLAQAITFVHTNRDGKAVNLKWHKSAFGDPPRSVPGHGKLRLYPLHLLADYDSNIIYFAEGEKDIVSLLSNGFAAVTATCGAGNIPVDLSILERFNSLITVMDNDPDGHRGNELVARMCYGD